MPKGTILSTEVVALLSASVAFVLSWLVQPHFRSLGFLTGIVDTPGYRRSHRELVPRTGGMAIFITFFVTLYILDDLVLTRPLPWSWLGALGGSGLAILALGVGDDRFHIHAEKKLYGQLLVILGLMVVGQRLNFVVLPFLGTVDLGGWAWPVTLLWYLGFINSMNLIDGLDGLASGIGVMATICIAAVAYVVGDFFSLVFASTLGGATLAFLYWNVSKRKIFLGDSGSMWMGLALASLLLHLGQKNNVSLLLLLAPMVIPIWDTGTTIIRRYRKRASIFEADDYHLHHRLVRLGFQPSSTVKLLLLITAGSVLFALSDSLSIPWLGLPALACWLWPVQIWGDRRRREAGKPALDFFSELLFVLGLDDKVEDTFHRRRRQVAEIIDIQTERNKVTRVISAAAAAGSGTSSEIIDHPDTTVHSAKESSLGNKRRTDRDNVVLSSSHRDSD
jgi:UDP-GlcNAc:undecaprenyl-phosphate/decaprenyl-phosphate GlcNAc-1-phosphate transferase